MGRSAGSKRQVPDLRPAAENQTPLCPMRGEALEAKRGMGQKTTGEKSMNANQINKHIKQFGVKICRGEGYYYWLDLIGDYAIANVSSVYVYRARQLPLERWVELAKEAATCR